MATGVISCALASGITFGYAALKTVLVEKGLYRDLCKDDELQRGVRICYLQDQRYVGIASILLPNLALSLTRNTIG